VRSETRLIAIIAKLKKIYNLHCFAAERLSEYHVTAAAQHYRPINTAWGEREDGE